MLDLKSSAFGRVGSNPTFATTTFALQANSRIFPRGGAAESISLTTFI